MVAAAAQPQPEPWAQPTDRARLAHTLVNQCASIGHDELILIAGGTRDIELLEDIAVEIRRLGAHPIVTIQSERLDRRFFTDVPAKYDAQTPTFDLKLAEMIDAYFYVDYRERPDLLADIPPQRLMDESKALVAVEQKMLKRGVRQLYLGNGLYPTATLARQFRVSQDELARIFFSAVNVDYTQLQATGEQVRRQLTGGDELEITAPNGTNLTVEITRRPVYVSDGVISTKDRQPDSPTCQVWLPAGEVYVTPVPGTANGTFVADYFFYEGQPISGLKLEFKNGRLTNMTAAEGDLTPLKKRYDAAPAGRDLFGVIDIGVNRNLEIPRGSRMVSWMAAGTISVLVGNDTWAGGSNDVPFWMAAHLNRGTLTLDGEEVVKGGKLAVREIE